MQKTSTTTRASRGRINIDIPDSKLCQDATELVRDTESDLLFNHSSRVYCFGALTGLTRGVPFDRELLYVGAMFHDMGLTNRYGSKTHRFEVDSANVARAFLEARKIARADLDHNIVEADIDLVWTAIALHTTPGIPEHMHPVVALLTAGVEMDVLGIAYERFSDAERQAVVAAYPRTAHFKDDIIQAFYDGMRHRPATTFGTVNADVLADKDPAFKRENFCGIIRGSAWRG
jgi:HD superfamily phosphodiesterase